ncbi:AAA family ATPase, partial [Providencia rettgeri]|nr:AAA family ATPase [Providencia rettgeri]
ASDYLAVDAWMMWDPLLSDAEHTGELRVVASGEGRVNNHQFYLSRRDYLAQHGDIMRRLLTELTHTGQFIDSHRGEAARLLSAELGIDARSLSMAL